MRFDFSNNWARTPFCKKKTMTASCNSPSRGEYIAQKAVRHACSPTGRSNVSQARDCLAKANPGQPKHTMQTRISRRFSPWRQLIDLLTARPALSAPTAPLERAFTHVCWITSMYCRMEILLKHRAALWLQISVYDTCLHKIVKLSLETRTAGYSQLPSTCVRW